MLEAPNLKLRVCQVGTKIEFIQIHPFIDQRQHRDYLVDTALTWCQSVMYLQHRTSILFIIKMNEFFRLGIMNMHIDSTQAVSFDSGFSLQHMFLLPTKFTFWNN